MAKCGRGQLNIRAVNNAHHRTFPVAAGAALAGGVLLIVGLGWFALQELRVNGPIYQRIVTGKDLIANVVPPQPTSSRPSSKQRSSSRSHGPSSPVEAPEDLRRSTRNATRSGAGKSSLAAAQSALKAAHEPAKDFWQVVEKLFLPPMDKGNAEAAGDAYLQIADAFRAHRGAIDEVVKLARERTLSLSSRLRRESARS